MGILYPFCTNNEFVKNTNSVSVGARSFLFRRVGLATNGVCVFGALTSVSALFYFYQKEGTQMKKAVLLITALVLSIALCACGKSKDTTPPTITMTTTSFTIDYGCEFDITDYAEYINISDDKDGNIDVSKLGTDEKIDTSIEGTHTVKYYVRDSAGNIGTIDISITVLPKTMTYDSYTEEEQKMYLAIARGVSGIEEWVKNPSSIHWIGFGYNTELDVAVYYFSATNGFGAQVDSYGAYEPSTRIADVDDNYDIAYRDADFYVTFDELQTFIDLYNAHLEE